MRRALLLATAGTALAAAVVPGHAAANGPADAGRVAATYVTFALGHSRTLSLEIRAAALSGGDVLRVTTQRCAADGSCAGTTYGSPIDSSALTIDPNTAVAELSTTIGGHLVHIQWRPDGSTGSVAVGSPLSQGTGDSVSMTAYAGEPATSVVQIDGRTCTGRGAVGTEVLADSGAVTGTPNTASLSALRLPTTAPLRCS